MYTWEIQKYILDRNGVLGGDELLMITNPHLHPQINHIKFNAFDFTYEMWDNEGNYMKFRAMPFEEAKSKGLVRERKVVYEK